MRFSENSENIPNELLEKRANGGVVFFCGAGVSRSVAKLPDFLCLIEKVMQGLKVREKEGAKLIFEAHSKLEDDNIKSLMGLDRVFTLLAKSYNKKEIEQLVIDALKPDAKLAEEHDILKAHKILLNLASTGDNKTRLITTNFDDLFEQAKQQNRKGIKEWFPPQFPILSFGQDINGIFYLHGKVYSESKQEHEKRLILSSEEYGKAYFSEGWARDFIQEIIHNYTVVFIGYSVNDPPIYYILQAFQDEIQKGMIYAFDSTNNNKIDRQELVDKWETQKITPIIYDNWDGLWNDLDKWSKRAEDEQKWQEYILELIKKSPSKLKPYERGQVVSFIQSNIGVRIFSENNPSAEWLYVFESEILYLSLLKYTNEEENRIDAFQLYKLDDDKAPLDLNKNNPDGSSSYLPTDRIVPKDAFTLFGKNFTKNVFLENEQGEQILTNEYYLSEWICKILDNPITLYWASKRLYHIFSNSRLKDKILSQFLNNDIYSKEHQFMWDALLRLCNKYDYNKFGDEGKLEAKNFAKNQGYSNASLYKFAKSLRPNLNVNHDYMGNIVKENHDFNKVLKLQIKYPKRYDIEVIEETPKEILPVLIKHLRHNLEYVDFLYSNYIGNYPSSYLFPSLLFDKKEGDDFKIYYWMFYQCFERLYEYDEELAKKECMAWDKDLIIFKKLFTAILAKSNFIDTKELEDFIKKIKSKDFWGDSFPHDLFIMIKNRWGDLSINTQRTIESKIVRMYFQNRYSDRVRSAAYRVLMMLHHLNENGCTLNINLNRVTQKLSKHNPDFKPEDVKTYFHQTRSRIGFKTYDTDYSMLMDCAIDEVIKIAENHERHDGYNFKDIVPFKGLSEAEPKRAIEAVKAHAEKNEYPVKMLKVFLEVRSGIKKEDNNINDEITNDIINAIYSLSDDIILQLHHIITYWFGKIEVNSSNTQSIYNLWNKLIDIFYKNQNNMQASSIISGNDITDWMPSATNSSIGHLTEILFKHPNIDNLENNVQLPSDWTKRAKKLLSFRDEHKYFVITILSTRLDFLYAKDTCWTERNILKFLNNNFNYEQNSFWSGYKYSGYFYPPLMQKMKSHILSKIIKNDNTNDLIEFLSWITLIMWSSPNPDNESERLLANNEFTELLYNCDNEVKHTILWLLWRMLSNKENYNIDDDAILKFFNDVWSSHKSFKTHDKVTEDILNIIFNTDDGFETIIDACTDYLIPIENKFIGVFIDIEKKENLLSKNIRSWGILLKAVLADNANKWPFKIKNGKDGILDKLEEIDCNAFYSDPNIKHLLNIYQRR